MLPLIQQSEYFTFVSVKEQLYWTRSKVHLVPVLCPVLS